MQYKMKVDIIRQKIMQNYLQPFVDSLKESNLDQLRIIQETFCCLQRNHADLYKHLGNNSKSLKILYDFNNAEISANFKEILLNNTDLKEKFTKLAFIYLDQNVQENELPGYSSIEIQTIIRELFHDYFNPLPELRIENANTKSISQENTIKPNGYIFTDNNPIEIQSEIYSYLDYKSVFSFRQTCKAAYFLHKSFREQQANIFYVLGNDVLISRSQEWFEGTYDFEGLDDIFLRDRIPEQEIVNTLVSQGLKEVKLFYSLYHALEYARYLHHGGHVFADNGEGFIPSLWLVTYIAHAQSLKFVPEHIVLKANSVSDRFGGNCCDVLVDCAIVAKQSILPLLGTVIFPWSSFASYQTLGTVDFQKYIQPKNKNTEQKNCTLM